MALFGLHSEECEAWLSGVCWELPGDRRLSDVNWRLYASVVQHGRFRETSFHAASTELGQGLAGRQWKDAFTL